MSHQQYFIVSGFNNLQVYCKINKIMKYGSNDISYTISFGGKRNFCFIAAIKSELPNVCYIDRVEYNTACVIDGSLREKGGTVELVKLALWTIKQLFPQVTKFTLIDDSYIYCIKNSKEAKLSLSYDFILKYNKTWYQYYFGARLPEPVATIFTDSLKVLDEPLEDFNFMVDRYRGIMPYRDIYLAATTPREFIGSLRGPNYCFEVGKWLEQYMALLGIYTYKDQWQILVTDIYKPPNYNIRETTNNLRGGNYTRRQKRQRPFSLIVHNSYGGWNN